jgi:uncharacterized repeat protein (TIGR03943 family)
VSRRSQGFVIGFVGLRVLRLSLTDEYLLFVKPAMRPWLVAAGLILLCLAVGAFRRPAGTTAEGHGHGAPLLAYLLVVPFAAALVVAPAPLGAYAAGRQSARTPPAPSAASGYEYPPLPPPVAGAYEMGLTDFLSRALYDSGHQMEGKTLRLTGFVTPDPEAQGFRLTRFVISCCAADGVPVYVSVRTDRALAPDTWVVVEGTWKPTASGRQPEIPVLRATAIRRIAQPADPYEG